MAFITSMYCGRCSQTKSVTIGSGSTTPQICHECTVIEAKEKEESHFKELDKLSHEERIRKIEKWIYHYKPPTSPMDMVF